jgi:hypothetical protein
MYSNTIDYLRRVSQGDLGKAQKAILMALALRPEAESGEMCWITDTELANLSSCTRRTIISHRQALEDAGWFVLIRDEQNQVGYQLATERRSSEIPAHPCEIASHTERRSSKIFSQAHDGCEAISRDYVQWCEIPSHPCENTAHHIENPHPFEYIEEFDYLAEQSLYWHKQCYTSARPACLYIDDLSEQPARPPESLSADQGQGKPKQADQEKGRQATTPISEDTAHEETPETLEDIFEADCTFFADQLKEHQVEHLSSTIPANVRASQKAFADSDTWRTFIEDKLCDLRPRISSDNHILSALRTDGKEWLVKRARNTPPHIPANIISLNDRKKPVKYPKARIPVEEGFGLGGKAHRFEKPDPDEPKRELTAVEQHLVQLMQLGGK